MMIAKCGGGNVWIWHYVSAKGAQADDVFRHAVNVCLYTVIPNVKVSFTFEILSVFPTSLWCQQSTATIKTFDRRTNWKGFKSSRTALQSWRAMKPLEQRASENLSTDLYMTGIPHAQRWICHQKQRHKIRKKIRRWPMIFFFVRAGYQILIFIV